MIQFFRRTIIESLKRSCRHERQRGLMGRLSDVKGQVGLVLILLAAIGLVFYAVSLNLSRASDTKTKTMIAAETSASFMASFMASYAQKISEENLRGKPKYCDDTSLLKRLVKWVILNILVAITIIFPPLAFLTIPLMIAATMSYYAMWIDMLLIQPGLTNKWNREIQKIATDEGKLIEYGVQQALMKAVGDNVGLLDLTDDDQDGVFGWKDPAVISAGAKDYVSRFGFYNSLRLNNPRAAAPDPLDTAPLREFVEQLKDFVIYSDQEDENGDGNPDDVWGLHDSVCDNPVGHSVCRCNGSSFGASLISAVTAPAECDPCCVPKREDCCDISGCPDFAECATANPPECCNSCSNPPPPADPHPSCKFAGIDSALCPSKTNAGCQNKSYMGNAYPLVFDPFYEDTTNNSILSFREQIGRDDESPTYEVQAATPDWHVLAADATTPHRQGVRIPIVPIDRTEASTQTPDFWFQVQDTTGFFPGDSHETSSYKLFYLMADLGVELTGMTDYSGFHCYWKATSIPSDPTYIGGCDGAVTGTVVNDMGIYEDPASGLDLTPLSLGPLMAASGNEEVKDLGAGGFPDVVPAPGGLFLADDECGDDTTYGWKRGSDRFCSTAPEYYTGCDQHQGCEDKATGDEGDFFDVARDCFCGEAPEAGMMWNQKFFAKDALEDFYYGVTEFFGWANDLVFASSAGATMMLRAMDAWYDEAAEWIEPACDNPVCEVGNRYDPGSPSVECCPGSYNKNPEPGYLYQWRDELETFYDSLNEWIYPDDTVTHPAYRAGAGQCLGTNAVWCVPADGHPINQYGLDECRGVTEKEQLMFDINNNGVRGDLVDVVACLDYNVLDQYTFRDPYTMTDHTPVGDQAKFLACANFCGPWSCAQLPRSLVVPNPIVSGENFYPLTWSDYELYEYCLQSKTYTECDDRCAPDAIGGVLPMGTYPINPGDYVAPDVRIKDVEKERLIWEKMCQWDTSYQTTLTCAGSSVDITCASPINEFDNCITSFITPMDSCLAIITGGAAGDLTYYNQLLATRALPPDNTTGSCHEDENSNGTPDVQEWAQRSADAAENLVKKLDQRLKFLELLLKEGLRVREYIGEGVDRFDEFLNNKTAFDVGPNDNNNQINTDNESILGNNLNYKFPEKERDVEWLKEGQLTAASENVYEKFGVDSPAELLVALRYSADQAEDDSTSVAVYVWRDADLPSDQRRADGSRYGYAHAVKVEVRVPKRCNDACGLNGSEDKGWPWIKTKTRRWGSQRCYYLVNYRGMVKARVIRWDEPKDSLNVFRFANNVPIWGMRTTHPDMSGGYVGGIFNDTSECYSQIDTVLLGISDMVKTAGGTETLHHAFMLNKVPYKLASHPEYDPVADPAYDACWRAVHQNMLQHGVHSESCAIYRWEGDSHGDMGVRFVPCDRDFLEGNN